MQQAVACVGVGFCRRQSEEVEVRIALGLQDCFHDLHGAFVLTGAGQLNGRGALSVKVVRGVLGPDLRSLQCCLFGAQVFGNTKGTLGNARILGGVRLLYIVAQGRVVAVALAGQLGTEQGEQAVFAERAVHLGFARRGRHVNNRRRRRWRGGVQGLAAAPVMSERPAMQKIYS